MKTPIINLVYLNTYPWTIGMGWEADLASMGLLGVGVRCQIGQELKAIEILLTKHADLTIFVCGETHLRFLHDTEYKADLIRSIPGKKVCLCWETITHSRFPGSKEFAFHAMQVFDSFGYSDETDLDYFRINFPQKCHFYCPFAATADNFIENSRYLAEKRKEVLFYGQVTTFGISEEIYKERRYLLNKLITKDWFCMAANIDTTLSISQLRDAINGFALGIHLPSNNHQGFTPRAFEVIASGSILLHPYMDPLLTPRSLSTLIPSVHYVPYSVNENILYEIEEVIHNLSHDRYESIRQESAAHIREFHTVEKRVLQIINFA